jgi:uncharacterized 2Fe-2S/4Fe-4S cluster protein (DUF4445 family)
MTRERDLVTILPGGKKVAAVRGENLADILTRGGVPLSLYCHKRGLCGKCLVNVVRGDLPLPDDQERTLAARLSWPTGYRLACRLVVESPVAVEVPERSLLREVPILETGASTEVVPEPAAKKYAVDGRTLGADRSASRFDALAAALGSAALKSKDGVLGKLPGLADGTFTAIVYEDHELVDLEPGDTTDLCLGAAVDLGTSTVVVDVLDLASGRSLGRASAVNSQAAYGADVVSRLTYAFQRPDHLQRLRRAIARQLAELIREASGQAGGPAAAVRDIVVAGNTAMNHLLLGIAVETLAVLPFEAVFSSLGPLDAATAGLDLPASAKLYIVPNIRSFVGGDITAGLAASGLAKRKGNWLFIDLGTNGEIVLKRGRDLIAASTAAGPAFEGMNISCGMLAVRGAVDKVGWRDGFVLSTVGNDPPRGLCGTGILDVLALAVRHGLITPDGKVVGQARSLPVGPGITLTQADVRNVQLAAAAVKSGVRMMLREFRVRPGDLDGVLLAGAFGNSVNIEHAVELGLIPVLPLDRVAFVGNSSLAGAKKLLLSAPARAEAEDLVGRIRHFSLAADARFQDEFVAALEFKPDAGGGS